MKTLAAGILAILCCFGIAAGDSITITVHSKRRPYRRKVEQKNIRILSIEKGLVRYQFLPEGPVRRLGKAKLIDVHKLTLDGQPTLTQAENLRLAGKWDRARTLYRRLRDQAAEPWLKTYINQQLMNLPKPDPKILTKEAPGYSRLAYGPWRSDPSQLLPIVERRITRRGEGPEASGRRVCWGCGRGRRSPDRSWRRRARQRRRTKGSRPRRSSRG